MTDSADATSPETPGAGQPATPGDRSVTLERANAVGLAMIPVLAAAVLVPFGLLHGAGLLGGAWLRVTAPLLFIPLVLVSIVVHEGLHAAGFLAAGVPRASLRFGFQGRMLTPYASCTVPVGARRYRFAGALPALVLGVVPALVSWITGVPDLAIFAVWMLAFAVGDLVILWLIRDLPPHALVIDHPDRAGCRIVS